MTIAENHTDGELNLVPFIDVMSTLVAFLLISAVWTNVAQLPARSGPDTRGAAASDTPVAALLLTPHATWVGASDGAGARLPGRDWGAIGAALAAQPPGPLQLAAEEGVPFQAVVAAMDVAAARGYTDVTLVTPRSLGFRR